MKFKGLPFVAEFLGTFLLVLAVIMSGNNPLFIGGSIASIIWLCSPLSGGHVNPAISLVRFLGGKLSSEDLAGYVAAQIAGAVSSLYMIKFFA